MKTKTNSDVKQHLGQHQTSFTQSIKDYNQTPIKSKMIKHITNNRKALNTKHKSATNINLTAKFPSVQVKYKCGCAQHSPVPKISHIVSAKIISKNVTKTNITKYSINQTSKTNITTKYKQNTPQPIKYSLNKIKSKELLSKILKKINRLQKQYNDLQNQNKQAIHQTIQYIPRQVIKSIDKVIYKDNPIEIKITKVKKVPKQVIKYQQKIKQILIPRQQLVFIDSNQKPQEDIRQKNVTQIKIKQIFNKNKSNQNMADNISQLKQKKITINSKINNSSKEISDLNQMIVQRSKSLQNIKHINQNKSIIVLLDNKSNNTSSVTTTYHRSFNNNNSNDSNINSKSLVQIASNTSLPKAKSILSLKSKVFINGKQVEGNRRQIENTNLIKSIVVSTPRNMQNLQSAKSCESIEFNNNPSYYNSKQY